jgi:hypothetical protein
MLGRFDGSPFLVRLLMRHVIHTVSSVVLLVGFMIAYCFFPGVREMFSYDPFGVDDLGPLELPAELVVGKAPAPMDWYPDAERGGLVIVTNATGDMWNPVPLVERMVPPWKERKAAEQETTDMAGGRSRDGRFIAHIGQGNDYHGTLTMREAATEKVVAEIHPFPATLNRKFVTWHPTMNVLAAAGGDRITLVSEPDWRPKTLMTAARDLEEWKRQVALGQEETGYHSNEMTSHLLFSADGRLMICAMDRGVRVYSWAKVLKAEGQLPPPEFAVDGENVDLGRFAHFRVTYTTAYDETRQWVLWAGIEGNLCYLDTTTKTRGTLLSLPKGYQITRMEFIESGNLLACEIVKMTSQCSQGEGLFLLDYAKLSERREEGK